MIWQAYLHRNNSRGSYLSESLSFFYNFGKYRYKQLNNYTNLSKKYSDLDYLKNESQGNSNYKHILDRWQIKNKRNLLSLFENIFNPLYKILITVIKILKLTKKRIFR